MTAERETNGRKCAVCETPLVGAQRMYCSNRCKQAAKYRLQRADTEGLIKENQRLERKVKRLEKRIAQLEQAA